MGARPETFRQGGGGFLNHVDGVITGYRFTDEFNGVEFEPGNKPGTKDPKFHSGFMELSGRVDGADEDVTQNLFFGSYDDYEVSEDGLTLTAAAGGECTIGANSAVAKFIASLVEAGFPLTKLSDDPDSINFEPIIGARVRFGQAQVLGKDGKVRMRVAKKGKFKGKEFPDTTTIIEQFYELPAKGKGGKTVEPVKGKKGKQAEPDEDEEPATPKSLATTFLLKIVKASKGKLAKAKISMALLKPENGLYKHPEREAIRKLLTSDKFLNTEDGWTYDEDKEIVKVEVDGGDDDE